jgi:hypothetical protein
LVREEQRLLVLELRVLLVVIVQLEPLRLATVVAVVAQVGVLVLEKAVAVVVL